MTKKTGNPRTGQHQTEELVTRIGDKDGMTRRSARLALQDLGESVVDPLLEALSDMKNHHRRWEAAKALGAIRSPRAAGALVEALMDESTEIRWLAAEALIALGPEAIRPLMVALTRKPDDVWLRHGAHHVLHALERSGELDDASQVVLDVMRSLTPEVAVPLAAHHAMETLRQTGRQSRNDPHAD